MMGLNGKFNYLFAKLQTNHIFIFRYSGFWKDNLPHGQGEYVLSNGNSFEGEYFKGEQEGFGVLRMFNGDTFTGDIRRGMPHGKGTLVFGKKKLFNYKVLFIAMLIQSHEIICSIFNL
jgi:hypothetical protein